MLAVKADRFLKKSCYKIIDYKNRIKWYVREERIYNPTFVRIRTMNNAEYPEDSESSDEDFDPGKLANEAVSEVDSDGDSEDPLSDKEDLGTRNSKRKKRTTKSRKKQKVEEGIDSNTSSPEKKELTEDERKKRNAELWAMFKKDTSFKAKPLPAKPIVQKENTVSTPSAVPQKRPEKVKITQIFEFAGEEVRVEKEVAANSQEAQLLSKPSGSKITMKGAPPRGRGGIGSVLSQLGKKQKITTLEKSKLDWDKFKKDENIEEELNTFNKGKDGYLEKQDFLQRTDVRRFEIERDVRNIERQKRMNDVN